MSKHIILVAGPVTHTLSEDVTVFVGGTADLGRAEWLAIDLKPVAAQCAKLCHELDIDPVLRVGTSSTGYPSLANNSGITDSPTIKNFPWDVFGGYVTKAYATAQVPLISFHTADLTAEVEAEAIKGDDAALTQVIGVAAGDNVEDAAVAKQILSEVPPAELEQWNTDHDEVAE